MDDMRTDDRDRVLRLIMARCPELSDRDLALLVAAAPDPDAIPSSVADKILDVVLALEDRMTALEEPVRPAGGQSF
jgi:hypothetical protein